MPQNTIKRKELRNLVAPGRVDTPCRINVPCSCLFIDVATCTPLSSCDNKKQLFLHPFRSFNSLLWSDSWMTTKICIDSTITDIFHLSILIYYYSTSYSIVNAAFAKLAGHYNLCKMIFFGKIYITGPVNRCSWNSKRCPKPYPVKKLFYLNNYNSSQNYSIYYSPAVEK